jgi:hypothetical protein
MSTIGKRTIFVGPAGTNNCVPMNVEGKAVTAIAPGTIVEQVAAGLQINAAAATVFGQRLLVADKNQLLSKAVDAALVINENMVAVVGRSGEFINVLTVTGQVIVKGAPMSLNGAGLLKLAVTPGTVGATSEQVLAYADETITTAATVLVRVVVA